MDKTARIGQYRKSSTVAGEYFNAYVPADLPFQPPLDMTKLDPLLEQANLSLGRLDGLGMILPDPSLFIYMYVRKEALLSSQIEGTQSSLSDLLLYEAEQAPSVPLEDVSEVSCYVSALNYGLQRLNELPLSLRLLRELHERLMSNTRGQHKQPGEFRTSQNWLGGTRPGNAAFVPPPPHELMRCLDNLEKFLHNEKLGFPVLIKAAIAHVQFETIHPFLDGNGRLGRLLITLLLCSDGVLHAPLLYLSLYLKLNRQQYYQHLQNVRISGDWESWIEFFLKGVATTAEQAVETALIILDLFKKDEAMLLASGRSTASLLKIYQYFQRHPVSNTAKIKELCGVSLSTALRSVVILEQLGLLKETTGKGRHKLYVYSAYLDVLSRGADPLV